MCFFVVAIAEEHAVVELPVENRCDDYLVEIPVVDVVLFVVVEILLLDVAVETVVVDPILNLLRWDDVVEAIVDGDVVVVVLVVLVVFSSSVAVVFVVVVVLLCLPDADEKFSLLDVDVVVDFVDLGAMQVHFYVVTLVLDVAVLFCAVFPNGFVVVVVEAGDVEVVVPFLLFDVVDFVPVVALDAMQVLVDDRFVVVVLVVVDFHSEIALFFVVVVVEPVEIHLRRL